jgi:hypothetical protein
MFAKKGMQPKPMNAGISIVTRKNETTPMK